MSRNSSPLPLAATAAAAFSLAAAVFIAPDFAHAGEPATEPPSATAPAAPECGCPEARKSMRPKFAGLPGPLDEGDEIATLVSIQHALTNAGDGQKYVWHRNNGRISGIVHPTNSFRNADGAICRHIVVMLTTGQDTRKTEGTACRGDGKRWELKG